MQFKINLKLESNKIANSNGNTVTNNANITSSNSSSTCRSILMESEESLNSFLKLKQPNKYMSQIVTSVKFVQNLFKYSPETTQPYLTPVLTRLWTMLVDQALVLDEQDTMFKLLREFSSAKACNFQCHRSTFDYDTIFRFFKDK